MKRNFRKVICTLLRVYIVTTVCMMIAPRRCLAEAPSSPPNCQVGPWRICARNTFPARSRRPKRSRSRCLSILEWILADVHRDPRHHAYIDGHARFRALRRLFFAPGNSTTSWPRHAPLTPRPPLFVSKFVDHLRRDDTILMRMSRCRSCHPTLLPSSRPRSRRTNTSQVRTINA